MSDMKFNLENDAVIIKKQIMLMRIVICFFIFLMVMMLVEIANRNFSFQWFLWNTHLGEWALWAKYFGLIIAYILLLFRYQFGYFLFLTIICLTIIANAIYYPHFKSAILDSLGGILIISSVVIPIWRNLR
jgi:hypothetical protein